ncbi:RyR domain-containing protein [Desulfotignum balticum]|uniref:RyR domain-containing protein n=1 Tax=Desulfotignum balticum TaxID=115781 RepID=UPI00040B1E31|nr:RyR domain-containing protein [Desulfotignum balticum]
MTLNPIKPMDIDEQVQQYLAVQPLYESYAALLEKILKKACKTYSPLAIVQVRAKTLSSFTAKAVLKAWKYHDPVNQFTDLCGARVITQTQVEVDRISRFIQDHFVIDIANSIDKRTTLGVSEFGYLSVHYIVQVSSQKKDPILDIPVPPELAAGGFKAEIQVRTMLQHAWAGISHDSLYKNMFTPPDRWHREMNRLAAALEEADQNFARFVSRLDTYAANHGAYLPADRRKEKLDTLKTILDKEPNPDAKTGHALQIADICRAAEDWVRVIDVLAPFERDAGFQVLRELGHALCRANRSRPDGDDYLRGMALLEKALALDSEDAQTHACLAWALKNSRQVEKNARIHDHLARAYELKPDNPYYLGAYLESEILSRQTLSHLPLMRPTLLKAIDTCKAHAEAGIELPMAFFFTGRFFLYLNMPDTALLAYLGGLRICLSDQNSVYSEQIQSEIDFLYHLERLKHGLPGYDAVLRLMFLARFFKTHFTTVDPKSLNEPDVRRLREAADNSLQQMKTPDITYQGPVVVLAGSCAAADESRMAGFQPLLDQAFAHFAGTVISGGTLSGVGKLAGSLQENHPSGQLQAMAYLPRSMPAHARPDVRYHRHIMTTGLDFSPLEPLQMWIDLLASGMDPGQIKVVGIGGGDISAFEYRLALTLGARAGILTDSGRAADELLTDPAWKDSPTLLPLVPDRMTVKLFISDPVSPLTDDQVEALAIHAHATYCQKRMQALPKDPNLQPWESLLPDFQNSNRQQIICSTQILQQAGFEIIAATPGEELVPPDFTQKEIEWMAEMEHGRWNVERLRAGWRYGREKDEHAKISPYLVTWDDLSDEIKGYDREAVCEFPSLLWTAGLKIRLKRKTA